MQIRYNISLTDVLAVWGAFVATFVLIWDIIKWKKSGPQIILRALDNMKFYGDPRISQDKTFISIDATNRGDRATTITNLGIRHYSNWFCKLIGKVRWQGVILDPLPGRLPHKLEPGERWLGLIDQKQVGEKVYKNGICVIELYLSHINRPKKIRVQLKNRSKETSSLSNQESRKET